MKFIRAFFVNMSRGFYKNFQIVSVDRRTVPELQSPQCWTSCCIWRKHELRPWPCPISRCRHQQGRHLLKLAETVTIFGRPRSSKYKSSRRDLMCWIQQVHNVFRGDLLGKLMFIDSHALRTAFFKVVRFLSRAPNANNHWHHSFILVKKKNTNFWF